jgi:hypothetical protein
MTNHAIKIALASAALTIAAATVAFAQQAPVPAPVATSPSVPTEPSSLPISGPLSPP